MIDLLEPSADVKVVDASLRDGDRGHAVLHPVVHPRPQTPVIVLSNFSRSAKLSSETAVRPPPVTTR